MNTQLIGGLLIVAVGVLVGFTSFFKMVSRVIKGKFWVHWGIIFLASIGVLLIGYAVLGGALLSSVIKIP